VDVSHISVMLPWQAVKHDLEESIQVLRDDLRKLKSVPPPMDWHSDVEALAKELDVLAGRLADHKAQTDLFPELPPEFKARIDSLESKVRDQTYAISEGIERTARAERRIGATIARARKELKSRGFADPGLEAEDRDLRLVDGDGSGPGGLQPVRESVEPADHPSSVKGVTRDELGRARGI